MRPVSAGPLRKRQRLKVKAAEPRRWARSDSSLRAQGIYN